MAAVATTSTTSSGNKTPSPTTMDSKPMEVKTISPDGTNDGHASSSKENHIPQLTDATLTLLSKQLEYYFSDVNLSRDTYLSTLRELNDGYVPIAIIISFAKVQALCPFDSYNAVIKAATDHSTNLVVVHVDKETSKRVAEKGPNTLLAIGPKDMKPIELVPTPTTPPTTPRATTTLNSNHNDSSLVAPSFSSSASSQVQNTIILREVAQGVTEEDIRQLFDFEQCPPIQNIKEDVSNYWFVTLATTSREDMINVMLALQSRTLKEEPIKARLKSGTNPSPYYAPGMENNNIYAGDRNHNFQYAPHAAGFGKPYNANGKFYNGGGKKMKPLNLRSPKEPRKTTNRRSNNNTPTTTPGSANTRKNSNIKPDYTKAPPPPLVESQFPALEQPPSAASIVSSKELPEDDDKPSDGSSTATTSTSSSGLGGEGQFPSNQNSKPKAAAPPALPQLMANGYAAALLKAPPVKPPTAPLPTSSNTKKDNVIIKNGDGKQYAKSKNGKKMDEIPNAGQQATPTPPITTTTTTTSVTTAEKKMNDSGTKTLSWGGGRSFADILKKDCHDDPKKQ